MDSHLHPTAQLPTGHLVRGQRELCPGQSETGLFPHPPLLFLPGQCQAGQISSSGLTGHKHCALYATATDPALTHVGSGIWVRKSHPSHSLKRGEHYTKQFCNSTTC